ncbi:MAG: type II toxin-antitoxin system HicA family toxin [Patescibacteria group bacterium]
MFKIPSLNARKIIRALKKAGFVEDRQKGSHLILISIKTGARTVIPIHAGRTIKKPLVIAIIHDAGLSLEEFIKLL